MSASLPFESLPHTLTPHLAPGDALEPGPDAESFRITRNGRPLVALSAEPRHMATQLRAFTHVDPSEAAGATAEELSGKRGEVVKQMFHVLRELWIPRGWEIFDSSPQALVKDDQMIGVVVTLLVVRPLTTVEDLLAELEFVAGAKRDWLSPELERGADAPPSE
jgi:hypothetical protein